MPGLLNADRLKNVALNISSSGDNTIIVAPSTTAYIAIDHINLIPSAAVNVLFKDGTTAVSGTYPLAQQQAMALENVMAHVNGIITCSPGNAFKINLGSAVQVSGFIRYRIVGE